MKVCPACQQTYADDSLNFCLNDGSVLVKKDASSEAPPATVFMNQPNLTNPDKFSNQTAPTNWAPTPPVNNQPQKKSKAWIWVLVVFGGIILLCGGGLIGLVAIMPENTNTANTNSRNTNSFGSNTLANNPKNTLTDDLSRWKMPDDTLGVTDYQNSEFYMTSKPGGYYFVLLSANNSFRTENATTRVSVRNTTGAATQSGFGVMVHNNMAAALAQDYAFLIDTVNKSYRIVEHQARKETVITKWTTENAIKTGTQPNLLEVKDVDGKMGFYINGKLVTTIQDKDGIKSGVPGLYASSGIPIAFSNLQIER